MDPSNTLTESQENLLNKISNIEKGEYINKEDFNKLKLECDKLLNEARIELEESYKEYKNAYSEFKNPSDIKNPLY